jgi:ferrous iron transport protein A
MLTLDALPSGTLAKVVRVTAPTDASDWQVWLEDIGFQTGEPVQVLTRHPFGTDPLIVRIGASSFALREAEARCIEVEALEIALKSQ